jgi:hypothetical protein
MQDPSQDPNQDSKPGSSSPGPSRLVTLLAGASVYLIIGLFFFWNRPGVGEWFQRNRWPLVISVALAVLLGVLLWSQSTKSTTRRIGLVVFVAIPIIAVLVLAFLFIPVEYQVPVLRWMFLLIVLLLPATMYYLFIASRRPSLLQEFFTNLSRLGLLDNQRRGGREGGLRIETEAERSVRVLSYIQKFEAVYGPIPAELAGEIISVSRPDGVGSKVPSFHQHLGKETLGGILTPETAIPVVLATLLIGLGWLLTLPAWDIIAFPLDTPIMERLKRVLEPPGIAVHFAFLGAYFFAVQMLFRRFVRKDLQASAYVAVSLRIVLAVIGTWAVVQALSLLGLGERAGGREHQALLIIGFVIGAFPPVAWQVIRAAFRRVVPVEAVVPSLSSQMPVSDLDGLTVWHEARLEEEDIENVPNMATADLVELMLHTRFPPDRIVDWVDQAILYTQLGPEPSADAGEKSSAVDSARQRLEQHGIRTATALMVAYSTSAMRGDLATLESILRGDGPSRIRGLVDTLPINPNLELVWQWRHLPPLVSDSPTGLPTLAPKGGGSTQNTRDPPPVDEPRETVARETANVEPPPRLAAIAQEVATQVGNGAG